MKCPNCMSRAIDFDYFKNMDKMRQKYSKFTLSELSREKLTFDEIVTIYTILKGQTTMAVTVRFRMNLSKMEPTLIYQKD